MDFGDILNNWETDKQKTSGCNKQERKKEKEKNSMAELLQSYAPNSEIIGSKEEPIRYTPNISREKMRRKKADLVLDLHGMTADEAGMELNKFIRKSYKNGARKILIIHGKGNHTQGQSVLKPLVRSALELSPYIGDMGTPERRDGGSGATWAVVRQRSL